MGWYCSNFIKVFFWSCFFIYHVCMSCSILSVKFCLASGPKTKFCSSTLDCQFLDTDSIAGRSTSFWQLCLPSVTSALCAIPHVLPCIYIPFQYECDIELYIMLLSKIFVVGSGSGRLNTPCGFCRALLLKGNNGFTTWDKCICRLCWFCNQWLQNQTWCKI